MKENNLNSIALIFFKYNNFPKISLLSLKSTLTLSLRIVLQVLILTLYLHLSQL